MIPLVCHMSKKNFYCGSKLGLLEFVSPDLILDAPSGALYLTLSLEVFLY